MKRSFMRINVIYMEMLSILLNCSVRRWESRRFWNV